ncbi:TMV resistance protein N-like [Quillaja saponaria]|uniref:TMV resistance protein N-like n=1 Tax=Quillaja saponaria TaxID=32244 RepID=A0AAD7Q5W2_QUISA|nr:TMV resistance protein N-like [Quillaja saponaria]
MMSDHVWLYHPQDLRDLDTYLLHDQNHVEISCEIVDASEKREVTVNWCGVYGYKQDKDVKDQNLILYTSSDPQISCAASDVVHDSLDTIQFSRKTCDDCWNYDGGLGIECYPLRSNMRICDIAHEQLQEHSISIKQPLIEGSKCKASIKGIDSTMGGNDARKSSKETPLSPQLMHIETWDPMVLECEVAYRENHQLLCEQNKWGGRLSRDNLKPQWYLVQLRSRQTKSTLLWRLLELSVTSSALDTSHQFIGANRLNQGAQGDECTNEKGEN